MTLEQALKEAMGIKDLYELSKAELIEKHEALQRRQAELQRKYNNMKIVVEKLNAHKKMEQLI